MPKGDTEADSGTRGRKRTKPGEEGARHKRARDREEGEIPEQRCNMCGEEQGDERGWVTCLACGEGAHKMCLGVDTTRFPAGVVPRCAKCLGGSDGGYRTRVAAAVLQLQSERCTEGTDRNLTSKLNVYKRFCREQLGMSESVAMGAGKGGLMPLEAILAFLAERATEAGIKKGTWDGDRSALATYHRHLGVPDDANPAKALEVDLMVLGAHKRFQAEGRADTAPKLPVTLTQLHAMLRVIADHRDRGRMSAWEAARDRAVLTLGFFGIMRGGEICGLARHRVSMAEDGRGVNLELATSKTEQARTVPLYLPARAGETQGLPAIDIAGIVQEYLDIYDKRGMGGADKLFRSARRAGAGEGNATPSDKGLTTAGVGLILRDTFKRAAEQDPRWGQQVREYAAHSLRRGGATRAVAVMGPENLKTLGRWKSSAWELYVAKQPREIRALVARM